MTVEKHDQHSTDPTTEALAPPPVVEGYVQPQLGSWYKVMLLCLFCGAEFMDAFAASALFPAQIEIERDLNVSENEITWEFSAFSASFAGFLLISGRISDVYSSKWTFVAGCIGSGLFSLGSGLFHSKVPQFLFRALTGIAGAMTVPSALSLIIEWFPDPIEQQRGIALFGGSSGIGSVLGIIIGCFFTQWATWRWIFYFITIVFIPIGILSIFIVPASAPRIHKPSLRRLDIPGVTFITASMIVFVYAVTKGSATGWKDAGVIVPLVVSILLGIGFFIIEDRLPLDIAALPTHIWKYNNIIILFLVGTLPYLWWCGTFYQFMPRFQEVYGWSIVMTGVHFIPIGGFSTLIAGGASKLVQIMDPKWSILIGLVMMFIGTIIFPFANTSPKYWSEIFPAMVIGTSGTMISFTNANIAIFMSTPPEIAGTVGAVFTSAAQLGLALGLAVITCIVQSKTKTEIAQGKLNSFVGIADGFWFLLAWISLIIVIHVCFYKLTPKPPVEDVEAGTGTSSRTASVEDGKETDLKDTKEAASST